MAEAPLGDNVSAVRRFNRFYTKKIGLLGRGLLKTQYPLTQARILFELAQHEQSTATSLLREVGIDRGYLSRILSTFEKEGLVSKAPSRSDKRHRLIRLTAKGKKAFSVLNQRSTREVTELLQGLSAENRHRLLHAMHTLECLLGDATSSAAPYLLRLHRAGDIGWIVHRHGVLYAEEYGFDETFEALVAEILARFVAHHDPKRERIWIAERDGERVGSVMIVDAGDHVAQLRLLLVEPNARGKGLGAHLIDECIDFSKRNGYRKIKLWTQSILAEARRLYEKAGFVKVDQESHSSFGHDLIAEVWELPLRK
ncbi:MAG: GNAT family N-acetyltransferase [Gemmatimonadales bacterium]|nr:GNAT family N-acetyltransferase [Gemmatimonadales bacterium]